MKIIKNFFKPIDLTKGKPWKVILLFAIPILLSTVLNSAFSLINALVLKETVGGTSVTAINQTGSITSFLFNFAYGCTGGFAVLISNKCGSKDEDGIKKVFINSLFLSILIAAFISILGLLIYPYLFDILHTDITFIQKASDYLEILLLSFVFMVLSNLLSNFLRGLGDATVPLIISFISTLSNIMLAFFFTGYLNLDTKGVALATLISNIINIVITLTYMFKAYPFLKIKKNDIRLDYIIIKDLLKLGLPLGFQWSILFIGSFVQASKVNEFGKFAQQAVSCYQPFEQYATIPLSVISQVMLSYTGQNYGAKNIDRIKHGIKDAIVIDLIFYSIVLIISQIIAKNVAYIFLPKEEINDDIIFYCSSYIKIITPFLICQGLLQISRSILQGIKKTIIPFISGIGELLARIFICLLIPTLINPSNPISNESYLGICFSTPLAWVTSLLIMGGSVIYIIYFKGIQFENSINK